MSTPGLRQDQCQPWTAAFGRKLLSSRDAKKAYTHTAAAIAAEVGVDEYRAEILPADKASFVEAERAKGHTVIMIGDGINDSPALSKANVGIAISDGAAIAREIADITIAADDLHELVSLRSMTNLLESS